MGNEGIHLGNMPGMVLTSLCNDFSFVFTKTFPPKSLPDNSAGPVLLYLVDQLCQITCTKLLVVTGLIC